MSSIICSVNYSGASLIRSPLFQKNRNPDISPREHFCFQQKFNSLMRKIHVPEPKLKIQEPKH